MKVLAFVLGSACLLVGCSDGRGPTSEQQRKQSAAAIGQAYDALASCGGALRDLHMAYVAKHDAADMYAQAFGVVRVCNETQVSGFAPTCSKVAPVGAEIAQRVMDAIKDGRDDGPVDDQYVEALSRCYADQALSGVSS